jgi:protein-disulfide isomerase-like protein with CxxC motif
LPRSAQDLAFHRFVAGAARQSDTDAVLDFTIALEALLLPYDENARRGDLGYRFRIHGAHYLSGSTPERLPVAKKLSGIYGMRSQLVHGEKYPEPAKISAARENAHELARRGLLRAVHEGFPKAEMFNQTVLGTTHEPLSEPQGRLPT